MLDRLGSGEISTLSFFGIPQAAGNGIVFPHEVLALNFGGGLNFSLFHNKELLKKIQEEETVSLETGRGEMVKKNASLIKVT